MLLYPTTRTNKLESLKYQNFIWIYETNIPNILHISLLDIKPWWHIQIKICNKLCTSFFVLFLSLCFVFYFFFFSFNKYSVFTSMSFFAYVRNVILNTDVQNIGFVLSWLYILYLIIIYSLYYSMVMDFVVTIVDIVHPK